MFTRFFCPEIWMAGECRAHDVQTLQGHVINEMTHSATINTQLFPIHQVNIVSRRQWAWRRWHRANTSPRQIRIKPQPHQHRWTHQRACEPVQSMLNQMCQKCECDHPTGSWPWRPTSKRGRQKRRKSASYCTRLSRRSMSTWLLVDVHWRLRPSVGIGCREQHRQRCGDVPTRMLLHRWHFSPAREARTKIEWTWKSWKWKCVRTMFSHDFVLKTNMTHDARVTFRIWQTWQWNLLPHLEVLRHTMLHMWLIHAFIVQEGFEEQVVLMRHWHLLTPSDQQNQRIHQQNDTTDDLIEHQTQVVLVRMKTQIDHQWHHADEGTHTGRNQESLELGCCISCQVTIGDHMHSTFHIPSIIKGEFHR